MDLDQAVAALKRVAAAHEHLWSLVVYGSQARGDGHGRSDWDIGYLADEDLDHLGLLADVTSALATNDVDLVDLHRASGLLRFRVATEAVVVHESTPGTWDEFALTAAMHWHDVEPIVRDTHDELLAGLG